MTEPVLDTTEGKLLQWKLVAHSGDWTFGRPLLSDDKLLHVRAFELVPEPL